jgi:hypothetical protein
MKTKEQYIELLSNFSKHNSNDYGIKRIGIFGSVARGEQKNDSDIDIYYEGEALSLFKLSDLKNKLEKTLETPVDIVRLRDSMNFILRKKIEKDGIYI